MTILEILLYWYCFPTIFGCFIVSVYIYLKLNTRATLRDWCESFKKHYGTSFWIFLFLPFGNMVALGVVIVDVTFAISSKIPFDKILDKIYNIRIK